MSLLNTTSLKAYKHLSFGNEDWSGNENLREKKKKNQIEVKVKMKEGRMMEWEMERWWMFKQGYVLWMEQGGDV